MRSRVLSILAVCLAAVGLGASLASLVDYLGPVPQFCAESGCATVRASAWAHLLGVPMPVFGVVYFVAMLVLAVVPRPRLRTALAIAGAVWALVLIGVQAFALGAWCKLCMIADPAAIACAIAVVAGASTIRVRVALASLGATAATMALALVLAAPGHAPELPAGTPDFVAQAQAPGAATIVELVDFECPFCRALAPKLDNAIARARAPVRIVRKMVPLPKHQHAMAAALAWCCADAQGKGDAMASALFAAEPDALTPDGCEKIAASVGCDLERYRRDLPAMSARVAADVRDARAAGVHSLPTVFIGGERVVGAAASSDELIAQIDRAAR
jgi:protein-disulfide isomerase